jgi:twitching motility protein PilT
MWPAKSREQMRAHTRRHELKIQGWQKVIEWGASVKASDIFWKAGAPPCAKIRGLVERVEGWPELTSEDTEWLARSLMNDRDWERFQDYPEKDIGLTIGETCRLRINVFKQRDTHSIAMRIISLDIMTVEDLSLPLQLNDISMRPQGMVLVTGPTGCGKSTTLAAMLDHINRNRQAHILTVEDPIEYVHRDKRCLVDQRQVGTDTNDFPDALKYAMRQAPDVILIGEMRDVNTMSVAMQAAETGHLVFSTVHTTSASETVERIVNMFPPHEKQQICMRLSRSLEAVISQSLIPRSDTQGGRVGALEIMVVTPTIAKFIEEGKPGEMYAAMEEGAHWGMQTMNQALLQLYLDEVVTQDHAMFYSGNRTQMRQMLRRADGLAADAAAEEAKKQAQAQKKRPQRPAAAPAGSGSTPRPGSPPPAEGDSPTAQ